MLPCGACRVRYISCICQADAPSRAPRVSPIRAPRRVVRPVTESVPTVAVTVFGPLRGEYDYLLPAGSTREEVVPGQRVLVPFGRAQRIGVVVGCQIGSALASDKLKPLARVLDRQPLLDGGMLALARWASNYYHHPLGDVLAAMLPTWLRRESELPIRQEASWGLTPAGAAVHADALPGAARQREVLALLAQGPCTAQALASLEFAWRGVMKRLLAKGWVVPMAPREIAAAGTPPTAELALNDEQAEAAEMIGATLTQHAVVVLDGVTGSGKTEVYFDAIARCLAGGRQALVLVPEIALTEQLVRRFERRFGTRVALSHSARSERERARTWADCRAGQVGVLIGTRSAVWTPFPALGLVVVDEEHDPSYKQQDGFRYSARDIAIVRAQRLGCPVVLGSATPSLETLANVRRGKYRHAHLRNRAVARAMPEIRCLDVRGLRLTAGLSDTLIAALRSHLERGEQVMLFLNRRGYSPLLICRSCGEPRRCTRCDAFLVYHKTSGSARCHHCDRQWPMTRPAGCCETPDIDLIGLGTERIEESVRELFPDARICRIDRDTARRKNALTDMLAQVANHEVDILIGTQIVAKGLDFAGVTLVGIVDADSRLYSVDFRAEERLAQLLIQVSGRAGRALMPGRVLIQTHHPEHPVLRRIIGQGYAVYADVALREREASGLPPYSAMALVRAESTEPARALAFLGEARRLLDSGPRMGLDISYPIPAVMERRAGRYRALVVVTARQRPAIGRLFVARLDALDKLAREHRVRWSLDIDPQDTL